MKEKAKLYKVNTFDPNCNNENSGMISIFDHTSGKLSFSWSNLPTECNILDNGKSVYGLNCGDFFLEIYNHDTKETYYDTIHLECKSNLNIDYIQTDALKCYNDTGLMRISWSGGLPPYNVVINGKQNKVIDNFFEHEVVANQGYNVGIIDSYNCKVYRNNITANSTPIDISLAWSPIQYYSGKTDVRVFITGGYKPYKLAWFSAESPHPLLSNKESIQNLCAGNYYLVIIDNNGCKTEKRFSISEPRPMRATVSSGCNNLQNIINKTETTKLYNLLLLPCKHNVTADDVIKSKKILLKHKDLQIDIKTCLDYGKINIGRKSYEYLYITPGLEQIFTNTSTLVIDGKEIELQHDLAFNNNAKLLIGSLLLNNDFNFAFENNKDIIIYPQEFSAKIEYCYIKSGFYLSNNITTILNFISSDKNNNKEILNVLNTKDQNTISVDTNKVHNGRVICKISSLDIENIHITLRDSNRAERMFYSKDISKDGKLYINGLKPGYYFVKIRDSINTCAIYNDKRLDNTDEFAIEVASDFIRHQEILKPNLALKYHISEKLLNYQKTPPKPLIFLSSEFTNGVLINISPSNACFKITGNNKDFKDIESCGKQVMDLDIGQYNIDVFQDGYIAKNMEFFVNQQSKEIVSVNLDRI